jgi:DNA-binding NtrC family response regulator
MILIIDDEPDICWMLEHILDKRNLMHSRALNGNDALALMKKQQFKMAFLDAKLPDIEGLDLAKQMLNIDPGIFVYLVSGFYYKEDSAVRKALLEGIIKGFISKPFDHDEINNTIDEVFASNKSHK